MWIKDFVNRLESSTLDHPRLDEAIALKQAHLPKLIYKYRRDSGDSRENLKTDTVWMASPDSYNDPYDCSFKVAEEHVVTALKKSLLTEFAKIYNLQSEDAIEQIAKAISSAADPLMFLAAHIAEVNGITPGNNPQQMAEFVSLIAPKMIGDTVGVLRQWRKVIKVCSFSAVNDSILMWGHYAQDHKGFCVEYDLESLEPDHPLRRMLYPVIYSPQLYDLTTFAQKLVGPNRQDFNPSSPLLGVLHKFDGWKYEEEWRVISFTQAVVDDHNWAVPTPSRVFLGTKMDSQNAKELIAICDPKGIEVCQMALAKDKFELSPHEVPHLSGVNYSFRLTTTIITDSCWNVFLSSPC
jgi:hypothetical protein